MKDGQLLYYGYHELGYKSIYFYQCKDCFSLYPAISSNNEMIISKNYFASCNKTPIDKCPWCRIDSQPFRYGRGI